MTRRYTMSNGSSTTLEIMLGCLAELAADLVETQQ